MIWLAGQVWPYLLLSALLGAGLVLALSTRRVSVERWVAAPAAPEHDERPVEAEPEPEEKARTVEPAEPASPFPVVAAAGEPTPWEQEELWSRPAKLGSPAATRGQLDEWADAAQNWRTWADEASGKDPDEPPPAEDADEHDAWRRQPTSADRDLFAADREAETGQDPVAQSGPGASFRYDQPVDTPLPRSDAPFPFAQPVEATPLPPTDPFPSIADPTSSAVGTPPPPERAA